MLSVSGVCPDWVVFSQGNALHQQQPACYAKDICVSPLSSPCTLSLHIPWSILSWYLCVIRHCRYGLFKGCTSRTCHCSMRSTKTSHTQHMPEPEYCTLPGLPAAETAAACLLCLRQILDTRQISCCSFMDLAHFLHECNLHVLLCEAGTIPVVLCKGLLLYFMSSPQPTLQHL